MIVAGMREEETERCFVAECEDEGRGNEPRNAEYHQKLEKAKKKKKESLERPSLGNPLWDSDV